MRRLLAGIAAAFVCALFVPGGTADLFASTPSASEGMTVEKGLTGVIIGWTTQDAEALPHVQRVLIGSPAERAGVMPGDIYTHIDGQSLLGLKQPEAMKIIRGLAGTTMRLRILRPGESKPLYFTIVRESEKTVRTRDRTITLPTR